MNRRSFLVSAGLAVTGPLALSDGFTYKPLKSVQEAVTEPVERPEGQIAMIVPDGGQRLDPKVPDLTFGNELVSDIFPVSISEARKRWGSVPDYVTATTKGQKFPGWIFVVNEGRNVLRLKTGDNSYRLSWIPPGSQPASELTRWHKSRIELASSVSEHGHYDNSIVIVKGDTKREATNPPQRKYPVRRTNRQWVYFGGDSGNSLRNHLRTAHQVKRDLSYLNDSQLRTIHANRHQGYPAFGALIKKLLTGIV